MRFVSGFISSLALRFARAEGRSFCRRGKDQHWAKGASVSAAIRGAMQGG